MRSHTVRIFLYKGTRKNVQQITLQSVNRPRRKENPKNYHKQTFRPRRSIHVRQARLNCTRACFWALACSRIICAIHYITVTKNATRNRTRFAAPRREGAHTRLFYNCVFNLMDPLWCALYSARRPPPTLRKCEGFSVNIWREGKREREREREN